MIDRTEEQVYECFVCGKKVKRNQTVKVENKYYCDEMGCRSHASRFVLTYNVVHLPPKVHNRS